MKKGFVPTELRKCAAVYENRNAVYGDNYKIFGSVMAVLFPDGLLLETVDDFNRFGVFVQKMAKITRYVAQYEKGGHDDSLRDNAVYSIMLLELDQEARKHQSKPTKLSSMRKATPRRRKRA